MTAVTVLAPAKINLTLHVLGRRPDGYHALTPYIIVDGAERAIAFYKEALGARELPVMNAGLPGAG